MVRWLIIQPTGAGVVMVNMAALTPAHVKRTSQSTAYVTTQRVMRVAQVHQMTVPLPTQQRNGAGAVMASMAAPTPALVRRTKQAVVRQP